MTNGEGLDLVGKLVDIYDGDEQTVLHVLSCVADYQEDISELLSFVMDNKDPDDIMDYAHVISQRRDPDDE